MPAPRLAMSVGNALETDQGRCGGVQPGGFVEGRPGGGETPRGGIEGTLALPAKGRADRPSLLLLFLLYGIRQLLLTERFPNM